MSEGTRVTRALLSVSDKTGIVELARGLVELDVEVVSTGGTAAAIRGAGLPVVEISEITGFPEIMDGRVKTLHPKVHGGLLARRSNSEHMSTLSEQGIGPIDLVAVNLYPFEEVTSRPGTAFEEAIENIDIGGPSMLRSAAKNFEDVIVLCDPRDYESVLAKIRAGETVDFEFRRGLALKVFEKTFRYDEAISSYLKSKSDGGPGGSSESPFGALFSARFDRVTPLRYGENPHQNAAFYRDPKAKAGTVGCAEKLSGKELSYNNFLDLDAALEVVRDFSPPTVAVIKHTNPCGVGTAEELAEAFSLAMEGDPVSAFGGIVGFNRVVDLATAKALTQKNQFFEVIVGPGFSPEALETITSRKGWGSSVRCVAVGDFPDLGGTEGSGRDLRLVSVAGGLLVQTRGGAVKSREEARVVTERKPSPEELEDLWFAWKVCKHVKSNAIVLAKGRRIVGVGAGQMSRIDSTEIATRKAGDASQGSVLASDAFFPFADGVEQAAAAGVTAVIQPGGSKKDDEVIAAADQLGLAMVFTGYRLFRH